MKKLTFQYSIPAIALIVLLFGSFETSAQGRRSKGNKVSASQKKEIEKIVRDYLINNPSILRQANDALVLREERERQQRQATSLKQYQKEIFADPGTPTGGNGTGDVTIAAFFDYNCGYCKKSLPHLNDLIKSDPSLKVIYKEFPILSAQSHIAAKAALAANRQGKYSEFHQALTGAEQITDETIKAIAQRIGLDQDKLQKDMLDPAIDAYLTQTSQLANALGIDGTPAYIIGGQVIPGAVDLPALQRVIAAERTKAKAAAAGLK